MANQDTLGLRLQSILEALRTDSIKVVYLVGKPGIGKTWMAQKVRDIVKQDGLFDFCFWLSMSRKHDKESPFETIAAQLPICLLSEEWDDNDDDEDEELQTKEDLKQKILAAICKKRCLLIFDGVSKGVKVDEIVSELETMIPDFKQPSFKVLVTTLDYSGDPIAPYVELVEIKPLSAAETFTLLEEQVRGPNFKLLFDGIHELSEGAPAKIEALAEALNYITEHKSQDWSGESDEVSIVTDASSIIPCVLQIAHAILRTNDLIRCFWQSWQHMHLNGPIHFTQLIALWIIEGCLGPIDCIEDTFEKGNSVLMELISHGFLKHAESNCVVMVGSLIKVAHWWIRREEDYLIYPKTRDEEHYSGRDPQGFIGTESYSMVPALKESIWEGFGDIILIDGVMKTVGCSSKSEKISTLLLDGNYLVNEVPDAFFQSLNSLNVLGIFNPMLKSLPASFSHMQELTVLVLRGCEFLENIDQIQVLKSLVVLEISGATSLTTIPNDLFLQMLHLQSLNFSEARVKQLPDSVSMLTELRWLILRGCCHLESFPLLRASSKLEVIDLSGPSYLKIFFANSFSSYQKLRMLDISHSQVEHLPFLNKLEELTQLVLRNCRFLTKLPRVDGLSNLQVLDLSGAISLRKIHDYGFQGMHCLKILDLSGTALDALPSIPCNLSHILLRNCTALGKLPSTKACLDLEVLDVSGSSNLAEIEDQSFQHLRYLRSLNLSNTKIRSLPSLSHLLNLHSVILRDCEYLDHLPEMEGLARLEVLELTNARSLTAFDYNQFPNMRQLILRGCSSLSRLPAISKILEVIDLSGCTDLSLHHQYSRTLCHLSQLQILRLSGIHDINFSIGSLSNLRELDISSLKIPPLRIYSDIVLEDMMNLQILNLSETPIFRDIFVLTNLTQLSLRGWQHLKDASGLEKLTRLEVLDLSRTAVRHLPSLEFLHKLCQLLLRDCRGLKALQHLESLSHLEVLDLWGTGIEEFPYEISELPCLKKLNLPLLRDTEKLDWGRIKHLPEELNWVACGIFGAAKMFSSSASNLQIMVSGSKFFQFLEENPILWDTLFKKFHFSVLHPTKQGEDGYFFSRRDGAKFRDIYTRTRCFPSYSEIYSKYLEIRSGSPLLNLEAVLRRASYVCLRDNANISSVSELGTNNIRVMRGCCIDGCTNMERVFIGEEGAIGMSTKLETLQVLNLSNLKSICNKNVQVERFSNLQHLHLDCCPKLEFVFSSSQQPMNLQTLNIKFCDNLKSVFEFDGTRVWSMKNLRTLQLFELPELKSIGAASPSLERLTGGECPKLDSFFACFFLFVCTIHNWSIARSFKIEEEGDNSHACVGLPKFPPGMKHMSSQKRTNEVIHTKDIHNFEK